MIKDRIKDFEQCISLLELISDNIDDIYVKRCANILIQELDELKEIFIMSVTYSEVN